MNRSHIRYTFCDAPFHHPVQCEHSLRGSNIKLLDFVSFLQKVTLKVLLSLKARAITKNLYNVISGFHYIVTRS